MGVTYDQECRAAARKLQRYAAELIRTSAPGGDDDLCDAMAWAFAGTLTHSHEAEDLVGLVAIAFDEAIVPLEDWPVGQNDPDPCLGLDLLRTILKVYEVLLDRVDRGRAEAAYEAIELIETWKGGDMRALCYLDSADMSLSLAYPEAYRPGWFRDLATFERDAPSGEEVQRLLKEIASDG